MPTPSSFPYQRSTDQEAKQPVRHPVIVIGAGPVGLCTAIDLAQRGTPVVVLDDDTAVSSGSRAVCYAKRSLEILDRLGCGDPVVDRGVRPCLPSICVGPIGSPALSLGRIRSCWRSKRLTVDIGWSATGSWPAMGHGVRRDG